ncbi:MAG TPA: hypothetical protein VFO58_18795 [Vicinamibacterales bacterium]|nr:hypothetical protein [Vicinamibacterales bacterium]
MGSRQLFLIVAAGVLSGWSIWAAAAGQQAAGRDAAAPIPIDADDIAGVVTSARGPEAGVWVIAETTDTQTKFRKIVVTDDRGRYLLPDLPAKATFTVWVRGYGLIDSSPVRSQPGRALALTAIVAPDARTAAGVYPANYWYSLIDVPAEKEFPGTGEAGNGIAPEMRTQHHWINQIKANCNVCHQMGNQATREIPKALGTFASSMAAWDTRVQVGQDGQGMSNMVTGLGRRRGLEMFATWTDRVSRGDIPPVPPRPQGVERNLVLTMWDWGGPATFAHDELTTDKRNPTANAYGPIYGVDWGNDGFLIVDPLEHTAQELRIPVLDPKVPPGKAQSMPVPSPYWGNKLYWFDPAITNHAAMDAKGRVWMSSRFRRPEDQPAFCGTHPSAALAPQKSSFRQVQYFDPNTRQFKQVNICFDTHHVQFAGDKDETLYGNGVFSGAIGWINTRILDETGDEAKAQGWCRGYHDLNQDGKVDPAVDRQIAVSVIYSVIPHPTDGTVWGAAPGPMPGKIIRIDPKTCVGEAYEPPFDPAAGVVGYTPRGIDVDSNGVIWTALASSGHLASFDRRKCKNALQGPSATSGQHCREGWTLHPVPGPRFRGVRGDVAVDFQYYNFVDRFDTFGLGANTPFANGTNSDSLLALRPDGTWLVFRVPYPLGFFSRGMDGRIDDPKAGWKGRAIYADYGPNAVWHMEGGLGTRSAVVKFQLRPDPLAR